LFLPGKLDGDLKPDLATQPGAITIRSAANFGNGRRD
jgi:hypothetical protein